MPFGPAQSLTLGNGVQIANSFDLDYLNTVDPTGEFGIVGGIVGGGTDLAYQKLVEGRSWSCVSWTQVGGAGALGAVTGGAGRALKLARDWNRAGRSMTAANAIRRYRRAMDVPGTHDVHHWLIPNASRLPNAVKNNPVNFNPIPRQLHQEIHTTMDPVRRLWNGSPDWAKVAAGAPAAGAAADAANPN